VLLATDTYAPPLLSQLDSIFYKAAGVRTPAYDIFQLNLPVPGFVDPWPTVAQLQKLRVQYVIISSAVYDRVTAAASVYPGQAAFYDLLRQRGQLLKVFTPGRGERGPIIKVYRI
jgi:hypothetical protein